MLLVVPLNVRNPLRSVEELAFSCPVFSFQINGQYLADVLKHNKTANISDVVGHGQGRRLIFTGLGFEQMVALMSD